MDQGQHEAAAALGLPRSRQQRRIILPQAMRTIVPTAVNEIIGLVKGTSVVYVLAYGELFYIVGVIYGRNQRVVPLLIVAGIWYLVVTTVITVIQYYVERHYAKGALRQLPPTPLQRARWGVGDRVVAGERTPAAGRPATGLRAVSQRPGPHQLTAGTSDGRRTRRGARACTRPTARSRCSTAWTSRSSRARSP